MKKPRKKNGAEYEFYNMFMGAINWDRVNNITDEELQAITGKTEKKQEPEKEPEFQE